MPIQALIACEILCEMSSGLAVATKCFAKELCQEVCSLVTMKF